MISGLSVVIFGGARVAMRTSAGVTYLHGDHLGSTSVASNTSGALVARQTYFPYGAPRTSDGTLPTDYTFTGQRLDASAGLLYYGARYYDAALGRFTSADTLVADWYNPQLLNRFAYVRNNPINLTDPTGHCDPDECSYRYRSPETGKAWWDVASPSPRLPMESRDEQSQSIVDLLPDARYISLGVGSSFPVSENAAGYYGKGVDIVMNYKTGEVAVYSWGQTGASSPQIGMALMGGYLWDLDAMNEYTGRSSNIQGSYKIVSGEIMLGSEGSYLGLGGGLSIGPVPASGLFAGTNSKMGLELGGFPILQESIFIDKSALKAFATIEWSASVWTNPLGSTVNLLSAWLK